MALHQLVFDTTDATSIADSAHVGAHVLSGTGDLITSGDGASNNVANTFEGLDVRSFLFGYDAVGDNWDRIQQVSGAIKVFIDDGDFTVDTKVDGVYDVSTNPDPDNVGLISHTRAAAPGDAQQTFRSTGGAASSDAVVAANVQGIDVNAFGMIYNGTTWDRLRGTGGSMNISDAALANTAIKATKTLLTLAGTAQDIIATPLSSRKYLWVYNNDNRELVIGESGVTVANGFPIPPGAILEMRAGPAVDIEFNSTKTSHDLRNLELS